VEPGGEGRERRRSPRPAGDLYKQGIIQADGDREAVGGQPGVRARREPLVANTAVAWANGASCGAGALAAASTTFPAILERLHARLTRAAKSEANERSDRLVGDRRAAVAALAVPAVADAKFTTLVGDALLDELSAGQRPRRTLVDAGAGSSASVDSESISQAGRNSRPSSGLEPETPS